MALAHHCKEFKDAIGDGYIWVEEDLREQAVSNVVDREDR